MSRSYTPQDLVQLPTRSAEDAYALASRLLVAASTARAPAALGELLDEIDVAARALRAQIVARRAAPGVDPKAAQEADRRLDNAWAALRDWLVGWLKIGDAAPRATEIRELNHYLFADGLAWLNQRYDHQWVTSDARLDTLRSGRNADLVRALGGGPILETLLSAHEAYGHALGTTREVPAPTEAKVREARDELLAAIREYVMAVGATVRRKRPETAAHADRLLRPLIEWQGPSSTSAARSDEPATDPPAEG